MKPVAVLRTLRGPALAVLLAAALGFAWLDQPNLWIDEIYTARWTRLSVAGVLAALRTDLHPPLYFLMVRVVTGALGESEVGLRMFSVLAGVAAVGATCWAFRTVLGPRVALGASLVLALMPDFGLYMRMARYYALTSLLGVIAHGMFLRLAYRDDRPASEPPRGALPPEHQWPDAPRVKSGPPLAPWLLYGLLVASLLYTAYAGICLPLAHGALLALRRDRVTFMRWLAGMGVAVVLFAPWLPVVAHQIRAAAALPESALPGVPRLLLMPAYELLALTSSELVAPWTLPGALGLIAGLVLLFLGVRAARGRAANGVASGAAFAATATTAVVAAGIGIVLLQVFTRATPFIAAPGRTLLLWPLAAALMALALADARRSRRLRLSLAAALAISWGIGWADLYTARHLLNPIYLTPGRQAARDLARDLEPGDLLLAEDDTGIPYYLAREDFRGECLDPIDSLAAAHALESRPAHVVWARLARDGSARVRPAAGTRALLEAWGRPAGSHGYLALDPTLRSLKARLLDREVEGFRIVVERYDVEASRRSKKKPAARYRM